MFKVIFTDGSWLMIKAKDIFAAMELADREFGSDRVATVEGC